MTPVHNRTVSIKRMPPSQKISHTKIPLPLIISTAEGELSLTYYNLMGTLQQAGHDGKTTSEGFVFSFTVWKHCTIQGSSISEKPHCLKWQPAQSCAAISPPSTTTLPDLMWPHCLASSRITQSSPSATSSCILSLIFLCRKFLTFAVLPSQEVGAFLALDSQSWSKNVVFRGHTCKLFPC